MLSTALAIGYVAIALAILMTFSRLLIGPSLADRILALDTLYVNAVALLVLLGIGTGGAVYFEAALLISLIGFIATVALAKFAARDDVME